MERKRGKFSKYGDEEVGWDGEDYMERVTKLSISFMNESVRMLVCVACEMQTVFFYKNIG